MTDPFAEHLEHTRDIAVEVEKLRAERVKPAFRYECDRRGDGSCVLALVDVVDGKHLAWLPSYELPRSVNSLPEVSSPSGRRANTTDGDNHWRARVIDLERLAAWRDHNPLDGTTDVIWITSKCRHMTTQLDPGSMIADAESPRMKRRMIRAQTRRESADPI